MNEQDIKNELEKAKKIDLLNQLYMFDESINEKIFSILDPIQDFVFQMTDPSKISEYIYLFPPGLHRAELRRYYRKLIG